MDRFRNTRLPDLDWWARLWPTPGATLRRLGVGSGDSLVEVGSGEGFFALPAARIVDPAPVFALDVDAELLADLEARAERQAIENVVTIHGDARDLPDHLPEPVDVVLFANAFHGVDEPGSFAQQAYDTLRPGGRFAVVNWHARPRGQTAVAGAPRGPPTELRVTPAETRAIVEDAAAFTRDALVELPPHHYGVVFER